MLISVLNKYWRPLQKDEFWHRMSWRETMENLKVSRIDEEIFDSIFTPLKRPVVQVKKRK